jgi:hypothetical protein
MTYRDLVARAIKQPETIANILLYARGIPYQADGITI